MTSYGRLASRDRERHQNDYHVATTLSARHALPPSARTVTITSTAAPIARVWACASCQKTNPPSIARCTHCGRGTRQKKASPSVSTTSSVTSSSSSNSSQSSLVRKPVEREKAHAFSQQRRENQPLNSQSAPAAKRVAPPHPAARKPMNRADSWGRKLNRPQTPPSISEDSESSEPDQQQEEVVVSPPPSSLYIPSPEEEQPSFAAPPSPPKESEIPQQKVAPTNTSNPPPRANQSRYQPAAPVPPPAALPKLVLAWGARKPKPLGESGAEAVVDQRRGSAAIRAQPEGKQHWQDSVMQSQATAEIEPRSPEEEAHDEAWDGDDDDTPPGPADDDNDSILGSPPPPPPPESDQDTDRTDRTPPMARRVGTDSSLFHHSRDPSSGWVPIPPPPDFDTPQRATDQTPSLTGSPSSPPIPLSRSDDSDTLLFSHSLMQRQNLFGPDSDRDRDPERRMSSTLSQRKLAAHHYQARQQVRNQTQTVGRKHYGASISRIPPPPEEDPPSSELNLQSVTMQPFATETHAFAVQREKNQILIAGTGATTPKVVDQKALATSVSIGSGGSDSASQSRSAEKIIATTEGYPAARRQSQPISLFDLRDQLLKELERREEEEEAENKDGSHTNHPFARVDEEKKSDSDGPDDHQQAETLDDHYIPTRSSSVTSAPAPSNIQPDTRPRPRSAHNYPLSVKDENFSVSLVSLRDFLDRGQAQKYAERRKSVLALGVAADFAAIIAGKTSVPTHAATEYTTGILLGTASPHLKQRRSKSPLAFIVSRPSPRPSAIAPPAAPRSRSVPRTPDSPPSRAVDPVCPVLTSTPAQQKPRSRFGLDLFRSRSREVKEVRATQSGS